MIKDIISENGLHLGITSELDSALGLHRPCNVNNKLLNLGDMDINVIYTAKDGRRFSDPYECEEYEKRLGTEPGTVARARIDLKALGENEYVFGMLKVRHKDVNHYRTYVVRCVDDKLEDYVTVSSLDVDKRWIRNTISDVLHDMEPFDDDDLCEYEFLYCDHWEFGGEHPFGCCRTYNPKLWDEMKKITKADAENAKK